MRDNSSKRVLVVLLASLVYATLAARADSLRASIRNLILATQRLGAVAQQTCNNGDPKGCDQALVARARIILLQLELRHPSGKIQEALSDVDNAMSDLEDAVENEWALVHQR